MQYQVRSTKNADGTYTFTYGKGKQKLRATVKNEGGVWFVADGDGPNDGPGQSASKKKDLKAAWGQWAESQYGNGHPTADGDGTKAGSPAPPKAPPPPPPKPKSNKPKQSAPPPPPPKHKPERQPDTEAVAREMMNADGLNLSENADKAYGAMLLMLNWAWRNRKDLNHKPWDDAMRALHHIDPDLHAKYKLEESKR